VQVSAGTDPPHITVIGTRARWALHHPISKTYKSEVVFNRYLQNAACICSGEADGGHSTSAVEKGAKAPLLKKVEMSSPSGPFGYIHVSHAIVLPLRSK
jgi:hypothetical protein